ncbi:hypothetical protein DSECCO2_429000 [anaerobic digester metagenome]
MFIQVVPFIFRFQSGLLLSVTSAFPVTVLFCADIVELPYCKISATPLVSTIQTVSLLLDHV